MQDPGYEFRVGAAIQDADRAAAEYSKPRTPECPYCAVDTHLSRDRSMFVCPQCFLSQPRIPEPLGSRT